MRPMYLILCPQCLFFLFVSKPISLLVWDALPQNSATLRVKPIGSCHSNQRVILPANSISTISHSFLSLFSTNSNPPAKWLWLNLTSIYFSVHFKPTINFHFHFVQLFTSQLFELVLQERVWKVWKRTRGRNVFAMYETGGCL